MVIILYKLSLRVFTSFFLIRKTPPASFPVVVGIGLNNKTFALVYSSSASATSPVSVRTVLFITTLTINAYYYYTAVRQRPVLSFQPGKKKKENRNTDCTPNVVNWFTFLKARIIKNKINNFPCLVIGAQLGLTARLINWWLG